MFYKIQIKSFYFMLKIHLMKLRYAKLPLLTEIITSRLGIAQFIPFLTPQSYFKSCFKLETYSIRDVKAQFVHGEFYKVTLMLLHYFKNSLPE